MRVVLLGSLWSAAIVGFFQRHEDAILLIVAAAITAGVIASDPVQDRHRSPEARQRVAVASDVVAGTSRGNQGLVGSLYLAPLPTVLVILISLVPFVRLTSTVCAVVAAAGAAVTAAYLNALWRRHSVPPALRYPAALCLLLFPPVAMGIRSGGSEMLFVALVVCGIGCVIEWLRDPSLRLLALSAILLALAVATRFQGVLFVGGAAALIALAVGVRGSSWSRLEGTVLTFLMPAGYVVLLWFGGNWLILGNPLFFLRAVTGPIRLGTADAVTVLAGDCPWLLLGLVSCLVFSVPLAASFTRPSGRGTAQYIAAGLAIVAAAVVPWRVPSPTRPEAAAPETRRALEFLEGMYPNGTFVVTGYSGYEFVKAAEPDPGNHWVHVMHLEPEVLDKVLRDYTGREVYLLLDASVTRDRWDEVGLSWERPGSRIPERFLLAGQAGSWTVFEVLRARD